MNKADSDWSRFKGPGHFSIERGPGAPKPAETAGSTPPPLAFY